MAKASVALTSFNAGEFSPLLDGRIDVQKYPNAASVLENFIPTVQGPIKKRAGTWYVNETRGSGQCVLVPFEFSVTQAYIIEFGDHYVRFHAANAQTGTRGTIVDSAGKPIEVYTPYAIGHILNADGSSKLRYAQSGDMLYVCCPGFPVYVLKRYSATSFVFERMYFKGGPFEDLNSTETTVHASGAYGTITLKASAGIFKASHVGSLFYIEKGGNAAHEQWTYKEPVPVGGLYRQSGNNVYMANNVGWCGTVKPTHTEGMEYDGSPIFDYFPGTTEQGIMPPVGWHYQDSGYGIVRITKFIDAQTVEGWVELKLPVITVSASNATKRWAFGAWNDSAGYPTSVAFFRSRLWFARGQKLWSSVAEGFDDFSAKNFGEVTADMGISITLSSGQINDIQWLLPDKDLIAGTAAGEFSIGELSNGDALGPSNIRAVLQSEYGSKSIQPVKNGSSILFMQRAGIKAREFFYSMGNDGYSSSDAAIMSEHITYGNGRTINTRGDKMFGVTQMAFVQEPDPIIWMLRTDKQLIGFTWSNEQEVKGWHRHVTDGEIESIAAIPAVEGDREELWLCVKRGDKRYIECMAYMYRSGMDVAKQFYVDCGLSYNGDAVIALSGLEHLEGSEVAILADGAAIHNQVVKNGSIKLTMPAQQVHVGLPYAARYKSMRIEAGAADGTAQGKTKRINKVAFRLADTGNGKYGPDFNHMDEFLMRYPDHAMDKGVPLFTGDMVVNFQDDYNRNGYIAFESNLPTNATLVGIYPQINTQDG